MSLSSHPTTTGLWLLIAFVLATSSAFATMSPPVIQQGAAVIQSDVPTAVPFNANAPAWRPPDGNVVEIELSAELAVMEIDGQEREVWTFDGSVPGPTLRVNQGDTIRFTLHNRDPKMEHGLDFHAGSMDPATYHRAVDPGESITFEWKAERPGVFFYHCSADPVLMHVANGMFGSVIVDPPGYEPVGREYVLIQHEWYENSTNLGSLLTDPPSSLAFNGAPFRYLDAPLTADPGEPIRFYFVNAGPNRFSAFHVIGGIFDRVLLDGNPKNELVGVQTVTVPPGGALITELSADTGTYPVLTHALNDASKGALGLLQVGDPNDAPNAHVMDSGREEPASSEASAPHSAHGAADNESVENRRPEPEAPISATTGETGGDLTGEVRIEIKNYTYGPPVTVPVGTTVTWVNMDRTKHSVSHDTSPEERLFDSTGEHLGNEAEMMLYGDTFSFTFDQPGVYAYTCSPHPYMSGTIIVEE